MKLKIYLDWMDGEQKRLYQIKKYFKLRVYSFEKFMLRNKQFTLAKREINLNDGGGSNFAPLK